MIVRPDKQAILEGLARFLEEQVKPATTDPALGYRVVIAASLARSIASELQDEAAREEAELARLRELVPDLPVTPDRASIEVLATELCGRIRARRVDLARARAAVRATLVEELRAVNPRFDPEAHVE